MMWERNIDHVPARTGPMTTNADYSRQQPFKNTSNVPFSTLLGYQHPNSFSCGRRHLPQTLPYDCLPRSCRQLFSPLAMHGVHLKSCPGQSCEAV